MYKKISLVFLLTLISVLSIFSFNSVGAFGIEGPGDGIDTSNICYGSGCLDTTPNTLEEMEDDDNWTAPINNFDFSPSDYPNFSNAYETEEYFFIPIGNIQGKDSCSVSNTELFKGEYVGPQSGTSSTYYNHGITGDFYLHDYYYQSSWLNMNHIVYDIYENCQEYEVINKEWSNDVSDYSIKEIRSYGYYMGLGIWVTHEISYFYFSYSEILNYLDQYISSLVSQFDITYENLLQYDMESFRDYILGLAMPHYGMYLYMHDILEHAHQAQISSLGNALGSLLEVLSNEPNKILKLTMDYKTQTGTFPIITRSYEILDAIPPITYNKIIDNNERELKELKYFSYEYSNTYTLLDQFAVDYLSVITVIDEWDN